MTGAGVYVWVSTRSSTASAGMVKENAKVLPEPGTVFLFTVSVVTAGGVSVPTFVEDSPAVCVAASAGVPVNVTVAVSKVPAATGLAEEKVTAAVKPFAVMMTGTVNG